MKNTLQTISKEQQSTSIDTYQSLGVMVVLDIGQDLSESELIIKNYYGKKLEALKAQTVFIGLNDNRQLFGYVSDY